MNPLRHRLADRRRFPGRGAYRPRLEGLEVRLAPALATRDIPTLVITVTDPAQVTSLVQALASNPSFGNFAASNGSNSATPTTATDRFTPADSRVIAVQGFVFGFSPFSVTRIILVETPTPTDTDMQKPPAVTVLPVVLPAPNFVPATLFALIGSAPAGPNVATFPALHNFLSPLNFPTTVNTPIRSLLFRPEPSGTSAAGSISGDVFQDRNANGQRDATEPDLGQVRLTLERWQGGQWERTAETVSNADGHFAFTGLTAGTYRVRLTTPAGQRAGRDIMLAPGANATGQDVGVVPRKRRAEANDRAGRDAAALVPPSLMDWAFSEWAGQGASALDGLFALDSAESRAAALTGPAPRAPEAADGLSAAEVLAFTTAVVAEFEGVTPSERDRRTRWLPL